MLTRRIVAQYLPATVSPKTNQITITPGARALALVLVCIAVEAATFGIGIDDLDEGYFVQQASRVLHGQIPYRDFETLYSPAQLYVHAAIITLTGLPLLGPRFIALFTRAGIAVLLFLLARPLVRSPLWAALPSVVLLLGLDDAPVRWEPHPGWLSTLFALLAVWCLSRARSAPGLVASGIAAALTFAFKQNTGLLILGAIVLWSIRHRPWLPLATFVGTTLVWLVPLAASLNGDLSTLGVLVGEVNESGLWSAPEPTILILVACLLAAIWLVPRDSEPRSRWYLLAATALAITELPRMDTTHLAWSAPLLLVLAAAALERSPARVSASVLIGTALLLAPNATSRLAYLAESMAPVAGVLAPRSTAADVLDTLADIQRRTVPGQPIFVYPTSPLLYVLADRPNPTRFDHLNPGAATADQIARVLSDLANVRLVIVSDFWLTAWSSHGSGDNARLEAWLATHFTEVARHGSYRVLMRDL